MVHITLYVLMLVTFDCCAYTRTRQLSVTYESMNWLAIIMPRVMLERDTRHNVIEYVTRREWEAEKERKKEEGKVFD